MKTEQIIEHLTTFFHNPPHDAGPIVNERSLQLEMAVFLRNLDCSVEFERSIKAARLTGSTLAPKHNLDLLVHADEGPVGIELKVPLNGQHPETMYAYCADIEFLEAIKRSGAVRAGLAIMLTPDRVFWSDSGRGSPIHNLFRLAGHSLNGIVTKPTGTQKSSICLEGSYEIAARWSDSSALLPGSRYLLLKV